jgi:hypothetical protein
MSNVVSTTVALAGICDADDCDDAFVIASRISRIVPDTPDPLTSNHAEVPVSHQYIESADNEMVPPDNAD